MDSPSSHKSNDPWETNNDQNAQSFYAAFIAWCAQSEKKNFYHTVSIHSQETHLNALVSLILLRIDTFFRLYEEIKHYSLWNCSLDNVHIRIILKRSYFTGKQILFHQIITEVSRNHSEMLQLIQFTPWILAQKW